MIERFEQWKQSRLVKRLRAIPEDRRREIVRAAWPGYHLSAVGNKGKRKEKSDASQVVHLPR